MFKYIVTGLLLVGMLGSAVSARYSQKPVSPKVIQADSGQLVYENYCLACHQEDGSGVPNLNPPLIQNEWVLGDSARLIKVVLNGLKGVEVAGESYSNEMPSHDFLSDKDIANVLTYIRKSFGNKASAITPVMVKMQRAKK
jgi:mono/diheme cytochrome c family protein